MLGQIRKFSSSIYAKVFLFIVAIPFIFWGMGDVFRGGNLNTIVKIGKDKISTQEFINYVKAYTPSNQNITNELIEKMLSNFIGEKLISKEIDFFKIELSNKSLSHLIKNQNTFIKDNKFSRTKYEKFLIKNNLSAVSFEKELSYQEKRGQLLNLIGGGAVPSNYMISSTFNKLNQKRHVELIDINSLSKKKFKFSNDEINNFYKENKDKFKEIYKSIKYIKLTPKNISGNAEINDLFFQRIDEIDDLIIEEKSFDFILKKFNLEKAKIININKNGESKNSEELNDIPKNLLNIFFNIKNDNALTLHDANGEYFITELIKTEAIQRNILENNVKKQILFELNAKSKRKLISKIINKINQNKFTKKDFYQLLQNENILAKNIILNNLDDNKVLKKEIVTQIYKFPEKNVVVVADIGFKESYLVYIDKVENASIKENSKDYEKYFTLSVNEMKNDLYNTYDSYLKKKYEININYRALDKVKNYF